MRASLLPNPSQVGLVRPNPAHAAKVNPAHVAKVEAKDLAKVVVVAAADLAAALHWRRV